MEQETVSPTMDQEAYKVVLRFSKEPIYRLKLDSLINKEKDKDEIMGDKNKTTWLVNEMYDHYFVRFPNILIDAVIKLSPNQINSAMSEIRSQNMEEMINKLT